MIKKVRLKKRTEKVQNKYNKQCELIRIKLLQMLIYCTIKKGCVFNWNVQTVIKMLQE